MTIEELIEQNRKAAKDAKRRLIAALKAGTPVEDSARRARCERAGVYGDDEGGAS